MKCFANLRPSLAPLPGPEVPRWCRLTACTKRPLGGMDSFASRWRYSIPSANGWAGMCGLRKTPSSPMLRDEVLVALGEFGDKQVTAEARRRFEMSLQNPQAVSPAVRRTALSIVARESDKETFDRLIALLHATQDPLEKLDISGRWGVSWIRWVRNGCSNLRSGATRRQERRLSLILNSNMIYPNTSRQNTTQ
jgi:ERAP1-like C-terminal domain